MLISESQMHDVQKLSDGLTILYLFTFLFCLIKVDVLFNFNVNVFEAVEYDCRYKFSFIRNGG